MNSPSSSDPNWKKKLTPEQYRVLRGKGTEAPFTGKYYDHHESGMYVCVGCGEKLFTSEDKYDSRCGWPSFTVPASQEAVATQTDHSHGMHRTEVLCRKCGGHLGHVFPDGAGPKGLRYCINSVSLDFQKNPKND